MVAATGVMMSAVTTGAAGAAKPAATTASSDDATQGAAGDFVQMIAELLGGSSVLTAPATLAASPTTAGASASSDEQSGTDTKKAADDSALTDMLALGMTLPFTPTPQAPAAATPATPKNAGSDAALDALSGDSKSASGNANLDALRLQQLNKMLSKDSPVTTTATAEKSTTDGEFNIAALFGKNETTPATPADKSSDLLGKLEQATDTDTTTNIKPTTQLPEASQLQQANALAAKQPDNVAEPRQQLTIHARVGSHEWSTELGNKLTLMSTQNTQSASLQITPDHLGPVEVKIEVNQGQTSVWFTADQAETRTALEQSLPKLREMFAAQGMSLTDAGVFGQRSQQQQQQQQASSPFGGSGSNVQVEELSVGQTTASRSLSLGMLDTYA